MRPIKDYPNFYINNTGEVFSTARGKGVIRRKYSVSKDGYKRMSLTQNGATLRLHREVLKAFDRMPEEGELCRHLDGNPQNNSISNLKWGTPKENAQDCLKHKRNPFQLLVGEDSPVSKFSDDVIAEIRTCHEVGFSYREIIEAYGISKAHVSYIVNNRTRIKKEK